LRDPNYKLFSEPLSARKRGAWKARPGLVRKREKRRFRCDLVTENELGGADASGTTRSRFTRQAAKYFLQL